MAYIPFDGVSKDLFVTLVNVTANNTINPDQNVYFENDDLNSPNYWYQPGAVVLGEPVALPDISDGIYAYRLPNTQVVVDALIEGIYPPGKNQYDFTFPSPTTTGSATLQYYRLNFSEKSRFGTPGEDTVWIDSFDGSLPTHALDPKLLAAIEERYLIGTLYVPPVGSIPTMQEIEDTTVEDGKLTLTFKDSYAYQGEHTVTLKPYLPVGVAQSLPGDPRPAYAWPSTDTAPIVITPEMVRNDLGQFVLLDIVAGLTGVAIAPGSVYCYQFQDHSGDGLAYDAHVLFNQTRSSAFGTQADDGVYISRLDIATCLTGGTVSVQVGSVSTAADALPAINQAASAFLTEYDVDLDQVIDSSVEGSTATIAILPNSMLYRPGSVITLSFQAGVDNGLVDNDGNQITDNAGNPLVYA